MIHKRVTVSALLISLLASGVCFGQAKSDPMAKLSDICCLTVKLDEPDNFVDELKAVDESFGSLLELADDLVQPDQPGIDRKSSEGESLRLLLDASAAYIVVEDCPTELGDFAVILEVNSEFDTKGKTALVRNCISFLCKYLTQNATPSGTDKSHLVEHLERLNDALVSKNSDNWTVIASSNSFLDSIMDRLLSDDASRASRVYLEARNYFRPAADIKISRDTRSAKTLLISLGYFTKESWARSGAENIPWVATSISLTKNSGKFLCEFESTSASTLPLSGTNKMFGIYQPIKTYPAVPSEAIGYSIASFDLRSLTEFNKNQFDNLYGVGLLKRLHADLIAKLEMGVGREHIGNASVKINYGPRHKEFLKLFSTDLQPSKNEIDDFVDTYLSALRDSDAKGKSIAADYHSKSHQGLKIVWSDKLKDVAFEHNRIMNWLAEQNPLGPPVPTPTDFGIDESPSMITFMNHQQMLAKDLYGDKTKSFGFANFKGIPSGKGAVVSPAWVAIGNWYQINSVIDWEKGVLVAARKLAIDDSTDIFDREVARSKNEKFHFLEFRRKEEAYFSIENFWAGLVRSLGRRGAMSTKTFELVQSDPSAIDSLSKVQRVQFRIKAIKEWLLESRPHRIETRHIRSPNKNRLTSRTTWQFDLE